MSQNSRLVNKHSEDIDVYYLQNTINVAINAEMFDYFVTGDRFGGGSNIRVLIFFILLVLSRSK